MSFVLLAYDYIINDISMARRQTILWAPAICCACAYHWAGYLTVCKPKKAEYGLRYSMRWHKKCMQEHISESLSDDLLEGPGCKAH